MENSVCEKESQYGVCTGTRVGKGGRKTAREKSFIQSLEWTSFVGNQI